MQKNLSSSLSSPCFPEHHLSSFAIWIWAFVSLGILCSLLPFVFVSIEFSIGALASLPRPPIDLWITSLSTVTGANK